MKKIREQSAVFVYNKYGEHQFFLGFDPTLLQSSRRS